jgi:hypothetical protein
VGAELHDRDNIESREDEGHEPLYDAELGAAFVKRSGVVGYQRHL